MKLQYVFIVFYIIKIISARDIFTASNDLEEGKLCRLPNGQVGVCTKITHCPEILREALERRRTGIIRDRCGFVNNIEIVCCLAQTLPDSKVTKTREERPNLHKIDMRPADLACRQLEHSNYGNSAVIVNGTRAWSTEFAYFAALGYEDKYTREISYRCGGTLISTKFVLSAAHCVSNIDEQVPRQVRLGSNDLRSRSKYVQVIKVKETIVHPNYKRSQFYNDVALIRLAKPAIKTEAVHPICIDTFYSNSKHLSELLRSSEMIAIGYGTSGPVGPSSNVLLKTGGLREVDQATCQQSYRNVIKLPNGLSDDMMCAIDKQLERRSDACQGDSGGALLSVTSNPKSQKMLAITSFGRSCGSYIPGVYTKIGSYVSWIESYVWLNKEKLDRMIEDMIEAAAVDVDLLRGSAFLPTQFYETNIEK